MLSAQDESRVSTQCWSQKCGFSCFFSAACSVILISTQNVTFFPSQPPDNCLQLPAVSAHKPSAVVKAWASARRILGISSTFLWSCTISSHEVSSQLGGAYGASLTTKRREACCRMCWLTKSISQGGCDSSKVPAVLNGLQRVFFLAYQQHLGYGNTNDTSSNTFLGVGFLLPLIVTCLGL